MPAGKSDPRQRRGAARAEREIEARRAARRALRFPPDESQQLATARSPRVEPAPAYEVELVPGLEEAARAELHAVLGVHRGVYLGPQPGTLWFQSRIPPGALGSLGFATAVYWVKEFDVPRPRALLGEEHMHTLLTMIRRVTALHSPGSFRSFRFSAAGSGSGVFARLARELEQRTGLTHDREEGDLFLRVRPTVTLGEGHRWSTAAGTGFQVLLRLTPRPLAARTWRVCNLPGALNATVARAMAALTAPAPHDRFVNLTCGSGTLMVERLALGPARWVLGGDRNAEALACADRNLTAAGVRSRVTLMQWDAGRLPLRDGSVNALCSDLPYGMLMGSRTENRRLYPALVAEASRVAAPGAAMVLITQAVPLLQEALALSRSYWQTERTMEVQIPYRSGVLKPQVLLLRRTARTWQ